jgi:hypothetical protein
VSDATDLRSRDGLAAIVDVQRRQISQLETDLIVLGDALREKGIKKPSTEALTLTGIRTLLAEPDDAIEWLIEDRFAYGSVNLLAGKPKAGKSTLARYLAFCVATGTTFLGHRATEGMVWYLVLEDKRSEVRRHFRSLGATGQESLRFLFGGVHDLMPKLRNLALREKPACIIVDTLQRLVKAKDLNDYAEVTERLTPVMELARATGAALVLVHHAGKAERAGIDTVLGSTALAGSVDNIFLLNRTDRYRLLSSVQRIGADLEETVIALDGAGRISAGLSRHDADVAHIEHAMLRALDNAGGPMTRAEWLEACEGRRQLKLEALKRLITAPGTTIRRTGAGTKNDPYHFTANVTDSGSQVPSNSREPESSSLGFPPITKESKGDCGSQVPGSGQWVPAGSGDGRDGRF